MESKIIFLLLACALSSSPRVHSQLKLPVESQDTLVPSAQRRTAPDFTLIDNKGAPLTLSTYKGKVVLLDFWATWCHGCKQELPWYIDFDRRYRREGLAVIGVSMDEGGMAVVQPFVARQQIGYLVVIGSEALGHRYGLDSMPMTLLIDREGKIALSHSGVVDRVDFENHIRALLAAK